MLKNTEIKIIDFRTSLNKENENEYVIQPNYKVQYENVIIELKGKTFLVNIGCQSVTINKDNVLPIAQEFEGIDKKPVLYKLILPNDDKRELKSMRNLPIYKESSPSLHISSNGKVYDREKFSIVEKTITPSNEYFKKSDTLSTVQYLKKDRRLYRDDIQNIRKILNTMCDHFNIEYPDVKDSKNE